MTVMVRRSPTARLKVGTSNVQPSSAAMVTVDGQVRHVS
jgi:hypothetical protein